MKLRLTIIGLLGASAVALGALGAHALKNKLAGGAITADQLNGFDTAVKYQMYHTLAMFLLLIYGSQTNRAMKGSFFCFLAGILLFSGSLYFLTTRNLLGLPGLTVLGPVTPVGGLFLVAGWLLLIFEAFKRQEANKS